MEVATRVGWAAKGGFHHRGLHATGVVGHFSAAVGAGRMLGLNAAQLAAAQGIVVSTAAANQEFLQGGGWNKRLHPGWGAVAGLTAAQLAKHGFLAPRLPYEGKLGLYRTLVGTDPGDFDISLITDGLGTRWETENVAVKPIPACHATHSPADCAVRLVREHGIDPDEIEKVVVRLQQNALNIVAFPEDAKRRPKDDYEAKFSVQYVVAAALHRQKFGLAELSPDALRDQSILATATKVECELDPMPALPGAIPGGVRIHMRSGEIFDQYEAVNRGGADRAMSGSDIVDKYHDNANPVVGSARASALRDLLLNLEKSNAKQVMSALAC
jgi:2-methylcitrate dehydratase PrpD